MSEIRLTINGKECICEKGDTILQAAEKNGIEIPTLCFSEYVKKYGACGLCVVEAKHTPKLLRACSVEAGDGMVIETESERVKKERKITMELLMSDHDGDCLGPCVLNCPANTDAQGYVKQIALGNDEEAVKIIKEKIPMPACIGRICPHPCEKACRRQYVEEPISIAALKYFAADNILNAGKHVLPQVKASTGKKVGIIGGGPGGLAAAYNLAAMGHKVTVVDAMPKMGGMLRYGIPQYRLPRDIIDKEVAEIESLGVNLVNDINVGKDMTFTQFRSQFDATVVAIGAWKSSGIRCKGEDLDGVLSGIEFLKQVSMGNPPDLGKSTAIVGGGNTAMDACRTAVRCGCENVYVIYRRTRNEMPAEDIEIDEAIEEGVQFLFLTNPAEILGENGKVKTLKLQVMELGEPAADGRRSPVPVEGEFKYIDVDTVIAAIGQKVNITGFEELELNSRGIISADTDTYRTNLESVFAIGDATNRGASIAIAAIGEGDRAALVIDSYLKGNIIPYRKPYVSERDFKAEMVADREKLPRAKMPTRPAEQRKNDFDAIYYGFSDEAARNEAKRCLECGCFDYEDCYLIKHANRYEIDPSRFKGGLHNSYKERELVHIERNQGKCILCGLCVRVCDEAVGKGILGLVGRGFTTVIKPEFRDSSVTDFCKKCKKCAYLCPTGALKILDYC